jgi:hypothetical protein
LKKLKMNNLTKSLGEGEVDMSLPGGVLGHVVEEGLGDVVTVESLGNVTIDDINTHTGRSLAVADASTESRVVVAVHVTTGLKQDTTLLESHGFRLTEEVDGDLGEPLAVGLNDDELNVSSSSGSRINSPVTNKTTDTLRVAFNFNVVDGSISTRSTGQTLNGKRIKVDVEVLRCVSHVSKATRDETLATDLSGHGAASNVTRVSKNNMGFVRVAHTISITLLI